MRRAFRRAVLTLAGLLGLLAPALAQTSVGTARFVQQPPPPAFSPRPTGDSATIRIELVWANNPGTSSCPLRASIQMGIVEVHGEVPSDEARHLAMTLARENCALPVTDHLKVKPFAIRQHNPREVASLTATARDTLLRTIGAAAHGVQVQVSETGQISLTGSVTSQEQKTMAARTVQNLPGCTTVLNQLVLGGSTPLPLQLTTSAMPQRPTLAPSPSPAPMVDLLLPPVPVQVAAPVAVPTPPVEEMHLLQIPTVPGMNNRGTSSSKSRNQNAIARTTQFASTSPHAQVAEPTPVIGSVPIPVATAPLGIGSNPNPNPAPALAPVVTMRTPNPLVSFDENQEAPRPIAVSRPLLPPMSPSGMQPTSPALPVATRPNASRPATSVVNINIEQLQRRIESVSGPLAREVRVSRKQNEVVVEIQVPNAVAERQLMPRLMALPELVSQPVRVEVQVMR